MNPQFDAQTWYRILADDGRRFAICAIWRPTSQGFIEMYNDDGEIDVRLEPGTFVVVGDAIFHHEAGAWLHPQVK